MALPTNRIKKVKLPGDVNGDKTYDIIPSMLQDGTTSYVVELPTLTEDSTIALTSDLPNITITTTTGSESISDGTNTLNVVTRDTEQIITAIKKLSNKLQFINSSGVGFALKTASDNSGYLDILNNNDSLMYRFDNNFWSNSSSDLGTSSKNWNDLYLSGQIKLKGGTREAFITSNSTSGLIIRDGATGGGIKTSYISGIGASIVPYASNTSLGKSDSTWLDLYLSGKVDFGDNATINKDSSNRINLNIGGSTKVKVGSASTIFATSVNPDANNSYDLGSGSLYWRNLQLSGNLTDGTNSITIANIQPKLTAGTGIAITDNVISSTLEGIDYQVVQELPASGEKGIIYLVPNGESGTQNIYDEYIWIPPQESEDLGRFEFIGTTETDLSNYVTLDSAQTISGVKTMNSLTLGGQMNANQKNIINVNTLLANYVTAVNSIYPYTNNGANLGSSTYRWKDLYLSGYIYATQGTAFDLGGAGVAMGMDLYSKTIRPRTDNVENLGISSMRYKNLYLSGSLKDGDDSGSNSITIAEIVAKQDAIEVKRYI